jgi:plastocyanin
MQKKPPMKKIQLLFLCIVISLSVNAQVIHTIVQGTGDTFSPADITVNQGDIIRFSLSSFHSILQVSETTWNANGSTALPGGFSFPTGSGDYTTTSPGIIYYICSVHIDLGMKGTITVSGVTGINDVPKHEGGVIYPNPAKDFINYQAKSNSPVQEIRIIDVTGKAVKIIQKPDITDDQVHIDVGNLNKGMYFIQVKSEGGFESRKFLKS